MNLGEANEKYARVFRTGMTGWDVAALQVALNSHYPSPNLVLDGSFGPATLAAVKGLQSALHIAADGVCGAETQQHYCRVKCDRTKMLVPAGLVWGICLGESSGYFAATSPQYPNGTRDYGPLQDNKPAPATNDQLLQAFNPEAEAWKVAGLLVGAHARYRQLVQPPSEETAWKCALFSYNWPVGADAVAKNEPWLSNTQPWIVKLGEEGVKWEGNPVRTGWDWFHFYVGSKDQFVTTWSVT